MTKDDLEIVAKLHRVEICPVCHGQGKTISRVPTINPKSELIIDLKECSHCGHWWHSEIPDQKILNELYKNGEEYVVPKRYETETKAVSTYEVNLWHKIFNSSAKFSKKITKNKTFNYLEVGVGSGKLFNFFKEFADRSYGVEPGGWAGNSTDDSSAIVFDISNIPNDITFDLIIAHDVLEHLEDPVSMLKSLHALGAKDSIINCTFPNKDSWKAKIGRWDMIRPFGHLHYFSRRSAQKIFSKANWDIVEIRATRIAENSVSDLIKQFIENKEGNILYRLIKSLLIGQIILGKDQWVVIAKRKE